MGLRGENQDALNELRVEYRTVFALFHEQGQPYEEIAQALNRPVGTIKTWLHRARLEVLERLRRRGMLPDDGEGDTALPAPPARKQQRKRRRAGTVVPPTPSHRKP